LGYRFVPLGVAAGGLVGANAEATLADLAAALGESANLAIRSGDHAEYVAQAPSSRHSMRMFTEVGRRVEMHCTGVGKALLAQLGDDQVAKIVRRVGLSARTEHTLTTEHALRDALADIRRRGYALDDQEQEIGVRCVAVPVLASVSTGMAISVSGPLTRMTDAVLEGAVPLLQEAASTIGKRVTQE
jgi:IclR family acetate operon transcriptional repressor